MGGPNSRNLHYGGAADTLNVVKADLDSDFGLEVNVAGPVSSERSGRIYYIQARLHWTSINAIYEDAIDLDATSQFTGAASVARDHQATFMVDTFAASNGGFLYEDAAIIAGAHALSALSGFVRDHTLSLAMAGAQAADPLLNLEATLTLPLQGGQSTTNQAGLAADLTLPLQAEGTAGQQLDMAALNVLGHLGTATASQMDIAALAALSQTSGLGGANIILLQAALSVAYDAAVATDDIIEMPAALVLSVAGDTAPGRDLDFDRLVTISQQASVETGQSKTLSLGADFGAVQALGALTQADLAAQATFAGDLASLITDTLKKRASNRRTLKVPGGARTLTLTKR